MNKIRPFFEIKKGRILLFIVLCTLLRKGL